MKYSRKILNSLLGGESVFGIKIEKPLDIFSALLFFFVYEEKTKPNKFIQFFANVEKVTDLKTKKEFFRNEMENSFLELSKITINGIPFLTYQRVKTNFKFQLSPEALRLKDEFNCMLEKGCFYYPEHLRMGVSGAYIGLYIYFQAAIGKTEIDLKPLSNSRILKEFNRGYCMWKVRRYLKAVMNKFTDQGLFKYPRNLEQLGNQFVLHIQPVQEGLQYEKKVEDFKVLKAKKTIWKNNKPVDEKPIVLDFCSERKGLSRQTEDLNFIEAEFRLKSRLLQNKIFLKFGDSSLDKLIEFISPVSNIKRSEFKEITHNGEQCSVIEIKHLRTLYTLSRLGKKNLDLTIKNSFLDSIEEKHKSLVCDFALESLFASQNKKQSRQIFRCLCYRYLRKGAKRADINSFFHYIIDKQFKIKGGTKRYLSNEDYIKASIKTFIGTIDYLPIRIPFIAHENALIVPKGTENQFIQALSDSYRENFGDKRIATFKVTSGETVKLYKFTNLTTKKEIENEY